MAVYQLPGPGAGAGVANDGVESHGSASVSVGDRGRWLRRRSRGRSRLFVRGVEGLRAWSWWVLLAAVAAVAAVGDGIGLVGRKEGRTYGTEEVSGR